MAITTPSPSLVADPDARRRVFREARGLVLQHVCAVYEGGDLFRARIVVRALEDEEAAVRFATAGFDPTWFLAG